MRININGAHSAPPLDSLRVLSYIHTAVRSLALPPQGPALHRLRELMHPSDELIAAELQMVAVGRVEVHLSRLVDGF